MLVDRDRGLKSLDHVDVGPLDLVEELAGVDREAFDVLPLALGQQSVKSERTFPRATESCDDHQLVVRNFQVEILQVVGSRPTDADRLRRPARGIS